MLPPSWLVTRFVTIDTPRLSVLFGREPFGQPDAVVAHLDVQLDAVVVH